MKKKSVNTTQRLGKKIFIAGKVYDLQVMDKDEVEASVQEYLDSAIGKGRVRFELCTIGNMTAMFFHRGFDYNTYDADPKDVRYEYVALENITTRFRTEFDYQLKILPDTAQREVILEIIHKHKEYLAFLESALAEDAQTA